MSGKTGADAVYRSVHHICKVVLKFDNVLRGLVDSAVAATAITSAQGVQAKAMLDAVTAACSIWELIADFNSVSP